MMVNKSLIKALFVGGGGIGGMPPCPYIPIIQSSFFALKMLAAKNPLESERSRSSFFYDTVPVSARHQLRRDFPNKGDCAYACFQEHDVSP